MDKSILCCMLVAFAAAPAAIATAGDEPDLLAIKDAEVHMVGICQPYRSRFREKEVVNWKKLSESLSAEDGDGARLARLLSPSSLAAARSPKLLKAESTGVMAQTQNTLLNGLQDLIAGPRMYNVPSFTKSKHAEHIQKLLEERTELSYVQTTTLNRAYASFASDGGIEPVSEHYQTVTVTVAAGRDVILVLSSSDPCRWKVVLEKGARVSGCILSGYYTQEIEQDTIPTVYRTHYDAKGEATNKDGWYAYSETGDDYYKIKKLVTDLTGRKIISFQGQNEAPKEGFVVKPSPK